MPLLPGSGKKTISANIGTEVKAKEAQGYPKKKAVQIAAAIAYDHARKFDEEDADMAEKTKKKPIDEEELDDEKEDEEEDDDDEEEDDEDAGDELIKGKKGNGKKSKMSSRFVFKVAPTGRFERDGYAIYPDSILFEAGTFPERNMTVTVEDVANMVKYFDPSFVNRETNLLHSNFLKGRAAKIFRVWVDPANPKVLRGEVGVPLGLDRLMNDDERKVSIELHPRTLDTIVGLALDDNPRVKSAILMGKGRPMERTSHGQSRMQDFHDHVAPYAGACKAGMSESANAGYGPVATRFTSTHERAIFGEMHALALKGGAKCNAYKGEMSKSPPPRKRGYLMSFASLKNLFRKHKELGEPENIPMSLVLEHLEEETTPATQSAREPALDLASIDFSAVPAVQQVVEENEELRARLERLEDERRQDRQDKQVERAREIEAEASKFAQELIDDDRVFPHERANIITMFRSAAQDDDARPRRITFSAASGKDVQGSRVDMLRASYRSRLQHQYSGEVAVTKFSGAQLLANGSEGDKPKNGKMSAEERRKNLSYTTEGRAILDREDRAARGLV